MTKPIDKLIEEAGIKFPVTHKGKYSDKRILDKQGDFVCDFNNPQATQLVAHILNTWHQARKALEPIVSWWAFIQAEKALTDGVPFDEITVALSFMGSGASTNVTVGQLNELAKALAAMNNVE